MLLAPAIVLAPVFWNDLSKCRDDVSVKFVVSGSTGPTDCVRDGGLFSSSNGPDAGLAESAPSDDGKSVIKASALGVALWANKVWRAVVNNGIVNIGGAFGTKP